MPIAIRHRCDASPFKPPLLGMSVHRELDPAVMAQLQRRTRAEIDDRFAVPQADRYLWNFVTLPTYRGRGIYPRLLDAIVDAESVCTGGVCSCDYQRAERPCTLETA